MCLLNHFTNFSHYFASIACIFCFVLQVTAGNTMKVLANMTLNSTTTSVLLNNLTTGATYNVRLNSFTKAGEGPYSLPVSTIALTALFYCVSKNINLMLNLNLSVWVCVCFCIFTSTGIAVYGSIIP